MENQSRFDPSRKTVGAIYRDASLNNKEQFVTNGDLTAELQSSLVEDINETIVDGTKEFEGKPFYIIVHEKKDMQMPRMILRRMLKSIRRPYPEDDTIVFRVKPLYNEVLFCWCLPHWSEMLNMLENPDLFDHQMIEQIRQWHREDLHHFGFMKDEMGNWIANPHYQDKKLEKRNLQKPTILVPL